jgi:hypothetical protein
MTGDKYVPNYLAGLSGTISSAIGIYQKYAK